MTRGEEEQRKVTGREREEQGWRVSLAPTCCGHSKPKGEQRDSGNRGYKMKLATRKRKM